jgi:hypothetical protein
MPQIPLAEGVSIHCVVDDFLWPWDTATPVLMMHGLYPRAQEGVPTAVRPWDRLFVNTTLATGEVLERRMDVT